MRTVRVAILVYLLALLAAAAGGCACTCPHPGGYVGYGASSAPRAAPYSARPEPSYYERVREDRHRREVEKQLRDIKRNTQRKPPKL